MSRERKATVTVNWTYLGAELSAEVDVRYTPPTPAKTYGPPEDCYPGDGLEVTAIDSVTITEFGIDKVNFSLDAKGIAEFCDDPTIDDQITEALYDIDGEYSDFRNEREYERDED